MEDSEIRKYRRALRQFQRLSGSQFKLCSCNVTLPQCLILLDIDEHEYLTIGQLASNLRLDHSTLSRTVDGLFKKNLVERFGDDSDRRVVRIRLSDEGKALVREIHRSNDAYCRGVFAKIPPEQRSEVIQGFETLVRAYLDHEAEP